MTCPVCERQNIPAEAATCPQCDTDLRGLQLIAAMRAAVPATVAPPVVVEPRPRPWWPLAAGTAVLLGGGLLLGRGLAPAPATTVTPPVVVGPAIDTTASDKVVVQQPRDTLATPRTQPSEPSAAVTDNGFTYVVRRGDTLRRIAWRLYGRASLAARLQEENHIDDPRRLAIGQRLHLFNQ